MYLISVGEIEGKVKLENRHSNSEEYDDPTLYDQENEMHKEELPFLLKWASTLGGTIIDLACGTGRVTIPLASKGYRESSRS